MKFKIQNISASFLLGALFLMTITCCKPEEMPEPVEPVGELSGLNCSGARVTGTLYKDQAASNVWVRVPYSGGNGGTYGAQELNSTGVSGLKAKLSAGSLVTGSDSLTYEVSGTPTGVGTASFLLNVGGKSCSISIPVGTANGTITGLDCATPSVAGSLVAGVLASGVKVTVGYSGGNGGTHGGQTVSSTGVTGLEAMVSSGSFLTGAGALEYTITGTPSGVGTASFALSIGGQSCTLSLQVSGGSIGSLNCATPSVSGSLVAGVMASGVKVTVGYSGGNGGTHGGQTVSSTGVTGLEAMLSSGSFMTGVGTLEYTITGTPSGVGAASFALSIGGQSCNLSLQVSGGSIGNLNCSVASVTGSLIAGQAASNVAFTVPYTGGNGGPHGGQTVGSVVSGVTGLTATLAAGNFSVGSGNLLYTVTGVASGSGIASFVLTIGGQQCTYSIQVQLGAGSIGSLNCSNPSVSGSLVAGVLANGVKVMVPYGGGNGGSYVGQLLSSTGVTGLTASLSGGTFANGVGTVEYSILGTPASSGTANFSLSLGGQSCVLMVPVQAAQGSITSLNCSAAVLSGALMPGVSASGKTLTVPYSGGNGGTYVGQLVNSSGVSGLTVSLAGGTFMNGNGSLVYNLTGTPSSSGLASFNLSMAGHSCVAVVPVGCGAYVGAGVWKVFSCYNMGAANNNADPFTPSWEINGGYWQWGRKFEAAAGPTGSGSSQANSGSIAGWNMSEASSNAWLDNSKTVNDPCPSGYRVPTKDQWQGVLSNNTFINVGTSWNTSPTNYSSGKRIGSALFLPAAGYRSSNSGELDTRGAFGYYWSSTQSSVSNAWYLGFDTGSTYLVGNNRTYGQSVRCIEE